MDPIFYIVTGGLIVLAILQMLIRLSTRGRQRSQGLLDWRIAADELGLSLSGESLADFQMHGVLDDYEVKLTSREERKEYRDRRGFKRTMIIHHFDHQLHLHHPAWEGAEGLLKYEQRPMLYDDPRPGISKRFIKTFQFRGEQSDVTDSIYADPTTQGFLLDTAAGASQFSLTNGLLYKKRRHFTSANDIVATLHELVFLARHLDEGMEKATGKEATRRDGRALFEAEESAEAASTW